MYNATRDAEVNIRYAGDTRDLFKYDLVRHVMRRIPGFERFTFVPMLTEERFRTTKKKNSKKDLGRAALAGRAGTTNRELMEEMGRLQEIETDREYFSGIESYFGQENIIVDLHHRDTFSRENRHNYFEEMFARFPAKTLILLDPDIGLEIKNPTERHLLFDEVKKIHGMMDAESVLMIYQHIPRVRRGEYLRKRCRELSDTTGSPPASISDGEIVFFLLAREAALRHTLQGVLSEYTRMYPALFAGICR